MQIIEELGLTQILICGKSEPIRVLTTKTEFWYMYEDRESEGLGQGQDIKFF